MIWHSILNVLAALIRNAFQKGHQCIGLENDPQFGWTWECSCGDWNDCHDTEVEAIKDFSRHTSRKPVKV